MFNKGQEQNQDVKDGSTAIQAGNNVVVINNGLNYTQAKEVALDVFKSNFIQLAGEAKEIARQRAEEITEKFLQKLQAENPNGLSQAQTPDFQYGLFAVQRDYARTADENLGDLLVDLLVDRTKHPRRDMTQIVLNESIAIAPKLTEEQIAALSIIFYIRYCVTSGIIEFDQIGLILDKYVKPFVELLPESLAAFQHLEFTGCGTAQMTSISLEEIFFNRFQGFLVKGFDPQQLSGCAFLFNPQQQLVSRSAFDPSKLQIKAQNKNHLSEILEQMKLTKIDSERIEKAFEVNRLSPEEIKGKFIQLRPYLEKLFLLWESTELRKFTLTSVGIALGHANIKRITGEFADLKIWIN